MRKTSFLLILISLLTLSALAQAQSAPKREFRGTWIQIINGQFQGMSRGAMQANLTNQLDELQRCGVNAVMFQVRGEADALYESPYEPWSRFLTGVQGQAPSPYWDPLAWMVEQCHKRGMELHAWINPYRIGEYSINAPQVKDSWRIGSGSTAFLDPGNPDVAMIRNPLTHIKARAAEGMPALAEKLINELK